MDEKRNGGLITHLNERIIRRICIPWENFIHFRFKKLIEKFTLKCKVDDAKVVENKEALSRPILSNH